MRYSSDVKDVGYEAWRKVLERGASIRVYLDDQECNFVITADDEEGFVYAYQKNEQGEPERQGLNLITVTRRGVVRFEIIEGGVQG